MPRFYDFLENVTYDDFHEISSVNKKNIEYSSSENYSLRDFTFGNYKNDKTRRLSLSVKYV